MLVSTLDYDLCSHREEMHVSPDVEVQPILSKSGR